MTYRYEHAGDTAPRVRIHTSDGAYLQVAAVEADEVIDIIDALGDDDAHPVLALDLDGGRSQVHIPRAAVVRVDVDWDLGPIARARARIAAAWDRWT